MQQYVFPAVFIQNVDESYIAMIPDLGLAMEGPSIEETFLYIKHYLKVFCNYALKLGEDILVASKFEKVVANNKQHTVMLIDAIVETPKEIS